MGKRTYIADITAMALLYRERKIGTTMLSVDKINKFDEVINNNLDEINSSCGYGSYIKSYDESNLYFYSTNEKGEKYAVINPNADIDKAWSWHIGTLPLDIVVAANKDNALETIGLKLENEKLLKKTL